MSNTFPMLASLGRPGRLLPLAKDRLAEFGGIQVVGAGATGISRDWLVRDYSDGGDPVLFEASATITSIAGYHLAKWWWAVGSSSSQKSVFEPDQKVNAEETSHYVCRTANVYLDFFVKWDSATRREIYRAERWLDLDALLDAYKLRLRPELADRIKSRLEQFEDAEYEDDVEDRVTPSQGSLSWLLDFLAANSNLTIPAILLNRKGRFVLVWQKARESRFTLEFSDHGHIDWVYSEVSANSTPPPKQGLGTVENRTMARALMEIYKVTDWAIDSAAKNP